jgi:hypothetical protein
MLRRLSTHVRDQNWIAVAIDFVVVVVGIFMAFQLERWYETQRLQAQGEDHLRSLLEDFQESGDALDTIIDRFATNKAAAGELIGIAADEAHTINNEVFYRLLADSQRMASFNPIRQTYDSLVDTGAIDALADEDLKGELGSYFAYVDRIRDSQKNWIDALHLVWEPFILENLDRNMLIRQTHPEDSDKLEPVHTPERFKEVIGTERFRNVMAKRWHFYRDIGGGLVTIRNQADGIEARIVSNLQQFESTE